jgi:hypothetical protein
MLLKKKSLSDVPEPSKNGFFIKNQKVFFFQRTTKTTATTHNFRVTLPFPPLQVHSMLPQNPIKIIYAARIKAISSFPPIVLFSAHI